MEVLWLQVPSEKFSCNGEGNCVNGLTTPVVSIFGQVAYCNAVAFFAEAYNLIQAGTLVVPPLGMANDKQPCPTVRDFFVVDMDQSDNVVTTYLVLGPQIAQVIPFCDASLKRQLGYSC